jgi:hypothetical protein
LNSIIIPVPDPNYINQSKLNPNPNSQPIEKFENSDLIPKGYKLVMLRIIEQEERPKINILFIFVFSILIIYLLRKYL